MATHETRKQLGMECCCRFRRYGPRAISNPLQLLPQNRNKSIQPRAGPSGQCGHPHAQRRALYLSLPGLPYALRNKERSYIWRGHAGIYTKRRPTIARSSRVLPRIHTLATRSGNSNPRRPPRIRQKQGKTPRSEPLPGPTRRDP